MIRALFWVAAAAIGSTDVPAGAPSTVPFTIESSGDNPRVIVTAHINGHPMRMMVHSNAVFFAQLRHAQAAAFGVRLTPGTHRSYGIDRGGHVSDLGRDDGVAATLAVGVSANHDAPVTVFEVPQDDYGMLGTDWITANRVVVDYGRRRLTVAPDAAGAGTRADALRRAGYVALPMTYDAELRRYLVQATINGVTRRMTIATASNFAIDTAFAAAASLEHGEDRGAGSRPTGTHVPEYTLKTPVRVTIGGWTSPPITNGRILDEYGYSDVPRPADPAAAEGGDLGGAFLLQTRAVVDFGARTLFVKR